MDVSHFRRGRWATFAGLVVLNLTLLGALVQTDPWAAQAGDAAEWWSRACGLPFEFADAPGRLDVRYGTAYPPYGNRVFYVEQRHHGQVLYALPLASLGPPIAALKERLAGESPTDPRSIRDVELCRAVLAGIDGAPSIEALGEVARALAVSLPEEVRSEFERWVQSKDRVPLAVGFEAAFLLTWLLFAAWPWLWRLDAWRYAFHWFAAPTLLCVPLFLGYPPLAFSSGPWGGYLYGLYVMLWALPLSAVPCNTLDALLLGPLPPVLAWLAPSAGAPLALGIYGCVGLSSTVALGALLACPFVLVAIGRRGRGVRRVA